MATDVDRIRHAYLQSIEMMQILQDQQLSMDRRKLPDLMWNVPKMAGRGHADEVGFFFPKCEKIHVIPVKHGETR